MKKNRLDLEDYFDFHLIGLVSIVKEYKLVWHLNEVTDFQLVKKTDISMEFSGNNKILISNFEHKKDHLLATLLKNRLVAKPNMGFQYLVEELKQFDYLLKYKDETEQTTAKDILSLLKSSEVVEYAAILEPSSIKSRDNLIF